MSLDTLVFQTSRRENEIFENPQLRIAGEAYLLGYYCHLGSRSNFSHGEFLSHLYVTTTCHISKDKMNISNAT